MSVQNYKCPGCGAPIAFNPKTGGFKCEYCFSEYTEEAITAQVQQYAAQKEPAHEDDAGGHDSMKTYECGNCGAEVVAGDTSTAAFCYYCHSPVVLSDRLKGSFKPDSIIPFKITKKEAIRKFLNWAGDKFFIPKDFTSDLQQEKITGMYLPYWQADVKAQVDFHAVGRTVTEWESGNEIYTKTDTYRIDRKGTVDVNNLQKLAFLKIDENLINGISPYNEEDMKNFSEGYLAGFFAERYTEGKENMEPTFLKKAEEYTASTIYDSCACDSLDKEENNTRYAITQFRQLLLPTWILTYLYNGKTYVFAVNGQTGKACGELPFNKTKAALFSVGLGVLTSVLALLGGFFIW